MDRALRRCHNIDDVRKLALKRLPPPVRGYLEGGSEDETSLRRNRDAFGRALLVPQLLNDVGHVETAASFLGTRSTMPVFCAPTGFTRLFGREGERDVAAAATKAGVPYALSALGSTSMETLAEQKTDPFLFQIYVFRDEALNREMIDRARAAGAKALILTVDVPVPGNRERDLRTGMTVPPKLTLGSLFGIARYPGWILRYLTGPAPSIANVSGHAPGLGGSTEFIGRQLTPSVTWADAARMAERWGGPFAVKGILSPRDAVRAGSAGASAVILSNHGGRQLDGAPAPFEMLDEVAQAVGGSLEILLDGGIRRGTDVLKAVALGASACGIGRSYLYGLAAAGRRGVDHVLTLLHKEIERDLALLGCRSVQEVTGEHVRLVRELAQPARPSRGRELRQAAE